MSIMKSRTTTRRVRAVALIAFAAFAVTGVSVAAGDPSKPAGSDDKVYGGPSSSSVQLAGYARVSGTPVTLAPGGFASSTVFCPAGLLVFGGGESNSAPGTLVLTDSWPLSTTSWLVYVKNNGTTTHTFTPWAICGV